MYGLYKELHPPTAVDHCVCCRFSNKDDVNVVTTCGHILRVYRVAKAKPVVRAQNGSRLEQVFESRLLDSVISLGTTRLAKSGKDALLLTFKDAKVSVVEFDPETHSLQTMALHVFEDEQTVLGACTVHTVPLVAVDPQQRCAALLVYGTKLAVLPYQREELRAEKKATPTHSAVCSSFIIDLLSVSSQMGAVKDIQFLKGYNKPTLCVLYETVPTWSGRLGTFKDNVEFLVLTLDTSRKLHAVIWSQKGLPFDCFALQAVPKPLGGVLVFAVNSLIYFSQSYPHFGVSLNSLAEKTSAFTFKSNCPHMLTLDGSQSCFLTNDRFMLILRNGQIYTVSLQTDGPGMDLVRSVAFEPANTSTVQPTCVCKVDDDFVFVGSRCGNSTLLQFSQIVDATEPKAKKKKIIDILEQDLFGDLQSSFQSTTFAYKSCDSLLNVGPICSMSIGEPGEVSEEYMGSPLHTNMEVVTCSGHGRTGALSVLQRSIRPHVVSTFELPGHRDMFTLLEPPKQDGSLPGAHSYLLLSGDSSTMVLETGEEIAELGQSGFVTDAATVAVGNLWGCKYNIQVTASTVVLLEGATRIMQLTDITEPSAPIVQSTTCDPYIVLLLSDGSVRIVTLQSVDTSDQPMGESPSDREDMSSVELVLSRPSLAKDAHVTCVTGYSDESGLFTTSPRSRPDSRDVEVKREPLVSDEDNATEPYTRLSSTLDDEDEMLYGSSIEPAATHTKPEVQMDTTEVHEDNDDAFSDNQPESLQIHWCAVAYDNGTLEILSLPEFEPVFQARLFANGPKIVKDTPSVSSPIKTATPFCSVRDILLTGLGNGQQYPVLMSVLNEDILVYRALAAPRPNPRGRLQVQFVKVSHDIEAREKMSRKSAAAKGNQTNADKALGPQPRLLRPFTDVGGYSGVFVCGAYPHWVMLGSLGWLHTHPMSVDGRINTFAVFNNQNCPKGFLYFNIQGELRICVLSKAVHYDHYWPVRKVPLKATPHFIAYHPEAKVHAVVTGEQYPLKQMPVINNDEVESMKDEERDARFPFPTDEKFQLKLYTPGTWEAVPKCTLKFDDFEHVTSMRVGSLWCAESVSGVKDYILVATSDVHTDEVSSKGKVYVLDLVRDSASSEDLDKKPSIECQLAGSKTVKSPVTCVEAVDGHVVVCICQKIFIWQFKNKELTPVAFIDTDVYIHTMSVLRNFILIADVMKNVKLLRFRNNLKSLSLISRDPYSSNVYSVAFIVDGEQLGFVATDAQCNVAIYQYQPDIPECAGGRLLNRRCDIRVCDTISALVRVRCRPSVTAENAREAKWAASERRHATYFATTDGGLGFVLPVPEKVYRRLNMLQGKMAQGSSHTAGINPKAARTYQPTYRLHNMPKRNMLDGELLWRYANYSQAEKTFLAKQIGTEVHQILQDMMDVSRNTCHF